MTVAAVDVGPEPAAVRDARLDVCRGMAMILVVWGHAMIGVQRAVGADAAGGFAIVMVYAVHMPVFFFLSGLLARGAMAEDAAAFGRRLAERIVWPYLLWSLVLLAAHVRMSAVTNSRVERFDPVSILVTPPAAMWFLYVLLIALVAARGLRGLAPAQRAAVGLVVTLAGYGLDGWLLPHLRFVGLFLIATALSPSAVLAAVADRRMLALAAVGVASGAAHALAVGRGGGYPAAAIVYLPAAAGGIVLMLALAGAAAASVAGAALAVVGRRTMPIFVTHILVVAAVRILMLRAGVGDAALVVAVATAAGVLLPLGAGVAADRLMIARLLGWR